MKSRMSIILLVALVVSAGATFLVYRVVTGRAQAAPPTTTVICAARELPTGAVLKDSDLKTSVWTGPLPKGSLLKKEGLVGRGVIAPIYESELIVESRLAAPGAGGGLASIIPPGMRAVAVKVNEIVGVAGFVLPGMRVDVLIAGSMPGQQSPSGPKVRTILQNIEVLSAGQNYQKETEGKPAVVTVVNLLVNPEQAELLSLASNETKIQLVLRNPLDVQSAKPPGIAMAGLLGESAAVPAAPKVRAPARKLAPETPKAVAPPAPARLVVEVLNGGKRSEVSFVRSMEERP